MKKSIPVVSIVVLLLILLSGNGYDQTNISAEKNDKQAGKETIRLFNGSDLKGWYTFIKDRGRNVDPKMVFSVQKGIIRISGEEFGCITTEKEFENYHLRVEFRWGEKTYEPRINKARDSGILLHSQGADGATAGTWMNSIECQVIEGGTGDFIIVGDGSDQFSLTSTVASEKQLDTYIFQPSGKQVTIQEGRINWIARDPDWKDVLGFRGANDIEKPAGKWNTVECIANGNEITIYVNGKLVNHATNVRPAGGKIQIQSEGAEIFVRKVDLTHLVPNRTIPEG